MSEYNAKNYTEQGGEKTVIGGTLEIREGASVAGLPSAINQAISTATTVAEVKDDFNALLLKLKDAGLMTPDAWNVSVSKITTPSGEDLIANQSKVTAITIEDGVITVAVPVSELIAFPSSNPSQGTHRWVGMLITTGLSDITTVKYNGSQLIAADATEAAAVGGSAGDIVMWLKCDEIVNTPKIFTLWQRRCEYRTVNRQRGRGIRARGEKHRACHREYCKGSASCSCSTKITRFKKADDETHEEVRVFFGRPEQVFTQAWNLIISKRQMYTARLKKAAERDESELTRYHASEMLRLMDEVGKIAEFDYMLSVKVLDRMELMPENKLAVVFLSGIRITI